ncbi:MAG: MATE family efflux transporter [Clostridia bacterium]|nr:MATE family efflux transporter [Clostridia bacterium]
MKKQIQLSDNFNLKKIIRFTMPSVVMMVIMSIYSVVDGLFVSNLIGDMALSAVNVVMPLVMIIGAVGLMLGSGGSALVAKTLGEGDKTRANKYFSMIVFSVIGIGIILSSICLIFLRKILTLMGGSDLIIEDCMSYGYVMVGGSVLFMLQCTFQSFFPVAEKAKLGLILSISAGIANMALDYIFIKFAKLGILGAGIATVIGMAIGGAVPLIYFIFSKKSMIKIRVCGFYPKQFGYACYNGASEFMSNVSASFVGILYNVQLLKLVGERGIAAYSAMMYTDFVFLAVFFGFTMGIAPVISFNYGANNYVKMKNVFKKSTALIVIGSAIAMILAEALSYPLAYAFVGYDKELLQMTVRGFRIFAVCYVFCGINIWCSGFFTALCNGGVSAFISFLRSLLLRGTAVMLLPLIWGLDGIWSAVIVAEGLTAAVSVLLFVLFRKRYKYGREVKASDSDTAQSNMDTSLTKDQE